MPRKSRRGGSNRAAIRRLRGYAVRANTWFFVWIGVLVGGPVVACAGINIGDMLGIACCFAGMFSPFVALGGMFLLDSLDRASALEMDTTTGLNSVYAFGEFLTTGLDGFGGDRLAVDGDGVSRGDLFSGGDLGRFTRLRRRLRGDDLGLGGRLGLGRGYGGDGGVLVL